MRLTADLINGSLSYLNPLNERELNLRGHKIPAIENLGGAKDHDSLDLTDNDIPALTNLPLMPRLRSLLLAQNRITTLDPHIPSAIPHLTTLTLENNRLVELADLDTLASLPRLEHLVLLGNPVCSKQHYRLWVVWRCYKVRFLDFERVRDEERRGARELFGTAEEPTDVAKGIMKVKSRGAFVVGQGRGGNGGRGVGEDMAGVEKGLGRVRLSQEERKKVEGLIRGAKGLDEIARLEKLLSEGKVPQGG